MKNILSITFNPAIDKSTQVQKLVSEQKMKCTTPNYEPGGGGINVARSIKKLGGTATALYLSGGNTGKMLTSLLKIENINTIEIQIKNSTRENFIAFDSSNNLQYRFGMPGPYVLEEELKKTLYTINKIKQLDFLVVSGSMPEGILTSVFSILSNICKEKKSKLIIDTSGQALKVALVDGVFMLKLNIQELGTLLGNDEITLKDAPLLAKSILEKNHIEVVVISLGAHGALMITKTKSIHFLPPKVKVKSTVGAGDSMVGGIIYQLSKESSLLEAVQYGVACGTSATLNIGTELCNKIQADELYNQITLREITDYSQLL